MLTSHKRLMFHDFYYAGIEMEMKWRRTMTHFGGKLLVDFLPSIFHTENRTKGEKRNRVEGRDDLETHSLENDSIKIRDGKQNNS